MDLYLATTPYHLFNNIILKSKLFFDAEADLIVTDFSPANIENAERLKAYGLFKQIYFVKQQSFKLSSAENKTGVVKNRLKLLFSSERLFQRNFPQLKDTGKYDRLFFDNPSTYQIVLAYHYLKRNKTAVYHRVDCGIESYYPFSDTNMLRQLYTKSFFTLNRCLKSVFLNCPALSSDKTEEIVKIPTVTGKDRALISLLNDVFQYQKEDSLMCADTIFFDQYYDDDAVLEQKQISMLAALSKLENFGIKIHPRRIDRDLYQRNRIYETNSSFEMILLNHSQTDLSQKIYLSPFSTAIALPKMLFDQEPYLLSGIHLFEDSIYDGKKVSGFFMKLKSSYRNPNKVFLPRNEDELLSAVNRLLEISEITRSRPKL